METYFNSDGIECVIIHNADGSTWSGYKSDFDKMQVEDSTEIPTPDEA